MADNSESPSFWKRNKAAIIAGVCIASAAFVSTIVIIAVMTDSRSAQNRNNDDDARIGELTAGSPPCSSRRLFVGSLSDHFSHQQHLTGIYVEQAMTRNGRPRFMHETNKFYLQYDTKGIWKISNGQQPYGIRANSWANRPEMVTNLWKVRFGETDLFVPLPYLKVICVPKTFVTCKSGKIRLSSNRKKEKMGTYSLTDITHKRRQVYRQDNGTYFLYYDDTNWVIDKPIGRTTINLFVDDFAIRPEYIFKPWLSFNGNDGFDKFNVTVKCIGTNDRLPPNTRFNIQQVIPHSRCVGPFYYHGRKQPTCTKVDAQSYWCSQTAVYEGRWNYCKNISIRPHPECTFPFTFNKNLYHECTLTGYHRYWCSTTSTFSGKWRLCIG